MVDPKLRRPTRLAFVQPSAARRVQGFPGGGRMSGVRPFDARVSVNPGRPGGLDPISRIRTVLASSARLRAVPGSDLLDLPGVRSAHVGCGVRRGDVVLSSGTVASARCQGDGRPDRRDGCRRVRTDVLSGRELDCGIRSRCRVPFLVRRGTEPARHVDPIRPSAARSRGACRGHVAPAEDLDRCAERRRSRLSGVDEGGFPVLDRRGCGRAGGRNLAGRRTAARVGAGVCRSGHRRPDASYVLDDTKRRRGRSLRYLGASR